MKKIILIFVFLIFIIGLLLSTNGPLYKPGNLKTGKGLRSPLAPPSQEGVKPNYWKVAEDILLYYFSSGEGTPVLVIHGGPGFPSSKPWEGLEALEQDYKFHYYHQRGCGKSTRPVDKFESKNYFQNMNNLVKVLGMSAQLADIERIRRILQQEKLIIIGHSFGAFLATLYAVEFPENIEKMILIAPAAVLKMPVEEGGLEQLNDYLADKMKDEFKKFLARYFDYGKIFFKSEKELAEINLEFGKYYEAALTTTGVKIPEGTMLEVEEVGGWMVHAIYFSLGLKYDFRDELKKVTAPVLVIHGEKDVMPSSVSKNYAEYFLNGEYKLILGASHFSFIEKPKEFANVVSNFLKRGQEKRGQSPF